MGGIHLAMGPLHLASAPGHREVPILPDPGALLEGGVSESRGAGQCPQPSHSTGRWGAGGREELSQSPGPQRPQPHPQQVGGAPLSPVPARAGAGRPSAGSAAGRGRGAPSGGERRRRRLVLDHGSPQIRAGVQGGGLQARDSREGLPGLSGSAQLWGAKFSTLTCTGAASTGGRWLCKSAHLNGHFC